MGMRYFFISVLVNGTELAVNAVADGRLFGSPESASQHDARYDITGHSKNIGKNFFYCFCCFHDATKHVVASLHRNQNSIVRAPQTRKMSMDPQEILQGYASAFQHYALVSQSIICGTTHVRPKFLCKGTCP